MRTVDAVFRRRPPTVVDMLLILAALAGAFSLPARRTADTGPVQSVRITVDNHPMGVFPAGHDTVVSVTGPCGVSRIEIRGGRVRFAASCCRQHVCMDRGWISRNGDWQLCLPNRVMVRITGNAGDGGADAVSE